MLDADFLNAFKRATQQAWSTQVIDPTVSGFQFQRGTRWNPGLSVERIAEYEAALDVQFPRDYQAFLGAMNGTDLPTVNVYAGLSEPRQSVGVYSYPPDMEIIQSRVEDVAKNRAAITVDLAEQGYDLPRDAGLAPIYGHRYLVCMPDPDSSVVLSIVVDSVDAIVFGNSLREYLEKEFLRALSQR